MRELSDTEQDQAEERRAGTWHDLDRAYMLEQDLEPYPGGGLV